MVVKSNLYLNLQCFCSYENTVIVVVVVLYGNVFIIIIEQPSAHF